MHSFIVFEKWAKCHSSLVLEVLNVLYISDSSSSVMFVLEHSYGSFSPQGNDFTVYQVIHTLTSRSPFPPPPRLYLMICFGMDERRRVSILGMQDRRRTADTLLGPLWPLGGTVLTRSKRTLFSRGADGSAWIRGRGGVGGGVAGIGR